MTLKTRFALSFIGYTVAVLLIFGATYYVREKQSARSVQEDQQLKTLKALVTQCGAMRLAANPIAALDFINAVKADRAILSIACFDSRGVIQIHSDPKMIGKTAASEELAHFQENAIWKASDRRHNGPEDLSWYAPVSAGQLKSGWAQVSYNRDQLEADINARLLFTFRRLIWVATSTFVLALLIGLGLAWTLSSPIGGLVQAARAIGGGDLKYQSPLVERKDELGYLAKEINIMASKLAELDELKDEFIANVSHDLRSPVAAISMYLEFMLNTDPDRDKVLPKHRTWLTTIRENTIRLTNFVTNILDAAKIKAGKMEYHLEAVKAEETLRKVKALFEMVAKVQDISVESEIPDNLPPIMADPERFDQVVTNLVSNALKFTKRGGRVVIGGKAAVDHIEIYVADNGVGISKEDLATLFERFRQVGISGANSAGIKGTGIGLAVTKETVEGMGGRIEAASEKGKGARFTVRMPLFHGVKS